MNEYSTAVALTCITKYKLTSLRKFYCRCGDLVKHYEFSLFQMVHGILGHDHIQ